MPELDTGPCLNWPPLCTEFPDTPTPEQQALIDATVQAATEALWTRTKRRFGTCEMTLRPCRDECWPGSLGWPWPGVWQDATGWGWPFPALIGGQWINMACGTCGGHCSCGGRVSQVTLPYPVAEIVEILVDGTPLDPSAYRVDNWRLLIRTDGQEWPRCQDLSLDDTQPGTWSVRATYGQVVPTLGQFAVGQLATHMYKSCVGDSGCLLPGATVRQVQRQGVTKVFFDADTAFRNGQVGLYYPDLFVATYNPSATGTASILDIDGPRRRHAGSIPGPTP